MGERKLIPSVRTDSIDVGSFEKETRLQWFRTANISMRKVLKRVLQLWRSEVSDVDLFFYRWMNLIVRNCHMREMEKKIREN